MLLTRLINIYPATIAYYEVPHDGPCILFLHGNSESANIFKQQFNSSLNKQFHLVAIDLPGHGNSQPAEHPDICYNLPYMRGLITELIKKINKPIIIAGSSLGGHLALELIKDCNDLIKGIFIDGTPPLSSASDFANAFLPNPATQSLFKEKITKEELELLGKACINDSKNIPFYNEMVTNTDGKFRAFLWESLIKNEMYDEKYIAENTDVHIAVLHGENDQIINKEYYKEISYSSLWHNQIHTISNAAHMPCFENSETYNNLLTQFVNEKCHSK